MMSQLKALMMRLVALALGLAAVVVDAAAHPHAFIGVQATAQFAAGKLTALRQVWIFDEMYSQQSLEDVKPDAKGNYGRAELAELAKVNIDGLKEFNYFTALKSGGQAQTFAEPKDYYLELVEVAEPPSPEMAMGEPSTTSTKVKVLRLTFTLPLAQPLAIDAAGADFAITDPEIFIWFSLDGKDPIKLAGAPASCHVHLPARGPKIEDAFGQDGVVPEFKQTSFKIACGGH